MVMEVLIKDSIGGLGNRSNLQLASSGIQMGLGRLRVLYKVSKFNWHPSSKRTLKANLTYVPRSMGGPFACLPVW